MKFDNLLMKLLTKKYKSIRENIPTKYNIEDALEIIEDENYENLDLFIWVEDENNEPIFFDEKLDAADYINTMNPETIHIEFSDYILNEMASDYLVEYIIDTDELEEELKSKLIRCLSNKYIVDNNEFILDDLDETLSYVNDLSDMELFKHLKENKELFKEIVISFVFSIEFENTIYPVSPNPIFHQKSIHLIDEIYKDLLLNFHDYNFKVG